MRKIILVAVILFSVFSYGQKTKKSILVKPKIEVEKRVYLIDVSDFEKKDDKLLVNKKIKFKAGDDSDVDVETFIPVTKLQLDSIGISKVNSMIEWGLLKSKYSVKNKYTYIPRKIGLFYMDKKFTWSVKVEFTAQNDMGATKDATKYYVFDKKGEFLNEL